MCTINSVCQDDLLLVVGYFNARVESNYSKPGSVEWSGVRGNHSVGKANEAGRAPLTFCVVNGLTVMNTWYEKKDMYNTNMPFPPPLPKYALGFIKSYYQELIIVCRVNSWFYYTSLSW